MQTDASRDAQIQPIPINQIRGFVNAEGLINSGIFPKGSEPSLKTVRNWTRSRILPVHRVGHFCYYDPEEVAEHIRRKLKVEARG